MTQGLVGRRWEAGILAVITLVAMLIAPVTSAHAGGLEVPSAPQETGSYANARGSLIAQWIPPVSDGGSPVTAYEVTLLPERRTVTVGAALRAATFTGLGDGERHQFEIVAVNAHGRSEPSFSGENYLWTWTVPNAPTQVSATARRSVIDVTWRWTFGGGNVERFVVTAHPSGVSTFVGHNPTVSQWSAQFTGLSPDDAHTFTVAGINEIGRGPESQPSPAVRLHPVPLAPVLQGSVEATGDTSLRWTRPQGYDRIEFYRVCRHRPTGQVITCEVTDSITRTVRDARSGATYGYSVAAHGELGFGPSSNVVTLATPAGVGEGYHPVTPRRVLDTRAGTGAAKRPLTARESIALTIPGLPVGARSVTMNLTATSASAPTYVTVHATGTTRPTASHLNTIPGETTAGLVTVPVSADGRVSIYNDAGRVHLIADLAGYTTASGGSVLTAQAGLRLIDTRSSTSAVRGKVGPGETFFFGPGAIADRPAPTAALVNITATGASTATHLTAYPADGPMPEASNLNVKAGVDVANLAVVRLDERGYASLTNNAGHTHVVIDLIGVYVEETGFGFTPVTPTRAMDTRTGLGGATQIGDTPVSLRLTGVPPGARAVGVRTTVVGPTRAGNLMVHPSSTTTSSSTLNFGAGRTVGNTTVVPIGADGVVRFSASTGVRTHLVVDVVGYYQR